ncbi:MAG: hypothetical protein GTO22_07240, partial [Gemmatimonadales bacterium]|nr:hypothetical protein [Gemmatimonadales bacterium]
MRIPAVFTLLVAPLLVYSCAGQPETTTQGGAEPRPEGPCVAAVAVDNQNAYHTTISILFRSRRVRLGPVEPHTSSTISFECPAGEFQFIIDVGDPGVVPVDAATGRIPCWLTDKMVAQHRDTLALTVPGGLEGRLGPGLCPR